MGKAHGYLGLVVASIFLLIALWGLVAWLGNRHPGPWFWRALAVGQVGVGAQVVAGTILLALGGRRPWLHYAYGLFPAVVLVAAHRYSRRLEGLEWAVFAFSGLVIFGLLVRGYMTGTGG